MTWTVTAWPACCALPRRGLPFGMRWVLNETHAQVVEHAPLFAGGGEGRRGPALHTLALGAIEMIRKRMPRPRRSATRPPHQQLCRRLLCPAAQLDAADASKGSLEMTPEWIAVNRTFTLGRKGSWYEVPIRASVGATYKGVCGPRRLGRAAAVHRGQEWGAASARKHGGRGPRACTAGRSVAGQRGLFNCFA